MSVGVMSVGVMSVGVMSVTAACRTVCHFQRGCSK